MQKLFWKDSIAVLISGTRRSIKQYAWEKLRPSHVTPQQCGVLLALSSESGMSLGEVAGRIWCDNPTACRIVNKLVERGLVRSDSDAQDRRRFRLFLTDAGRELCIELARCADDIADTLEQNIAVDDLNMLRALLGKVMSNAVNATQRPDKTIAAATAASESELKVMRGALASTGEAKATSGSVVCDPPGTGGMALSASALKASPSTPATGPGKTVV